MLSGLRLHLRQLDQAPKPGMKHNACLTRQIAQPSRQAGTQNNNCRLDDGNDIAACQALASAITHEGCTPSACTNDTDLLFCCNLPTKGPQVQCSNSDCACFPHHAQMKLSLLRRTNAEVPVLDSQSAVLTMRMSKHQMS